MNEQGQEERALEVRNVEVEKERKERKRAQVMGQQSKYKHWEPTEHCLAAKRKRETRKKRAKRVAVFLLPEVPLQREPLLKPAAALLQLHAGS